MEFSVLLVAYPRADLDSILFLPGEVLFDIVDDDDSLQVPSQLREVLDVDPICLLTAAPVEPIIYQLCAVLGLDLVQDVISIVLQGCCENDNLEGLRHLLQELDAAWSQMELLLDRVEVDQRLVHVEDESVRSLLGNW